MNSMPHMSAIHVSAGRSAGGDGGQTPELPECGARAMLEGIEPERISLPRKGAKDAKMRKRAELAERWRLG